MKPFALTGARLFDGFRLHEHSAVIVEAGQITRVAPVAELPADIHCHRLDGGILSPGLVDLQVNGGGGVLLNEAPSPATVATMIEGHRRCGTTTLLPTLISSPRDVMSQAIDAVLETRSQCRGVGGIHLEGPFFSHEKRGVHHADYLRDPEEADIEQLCSVAGRLPLLLTLAPEHMAPGHISALVGAGVRVSLGHTNATYEQIRQALEEGASGFTHLYNAMRPLQGRDPGVVGAALEAGTAWAGIIADGIHVHPAAVRLALNVMTADQLYLVSDAMATVGSERRSFTLYGETIREAGGQLVNAEGRLAGAAISLADAVRISTMTMGVPVHLALRMATSAPARYMGLDGCAGSLAPGRAADMVHFSETLNVTRTWVSGEEVT